MKTYIKALILTTITVFSFTSCDKDEPTITIDNPPTYSFQRDGSSTVSFGGQTTRIQMATELVSSMTDFSNNSEILFEMYANETSSGADANPFSEASLNESSKSVKSKVAASKDFFSSNTAESAEIKADFENWITSQVSEVFPNQNEIAEPGKAGQIADGSKARYINAKGLEYNQMVGKSLIGALMVDQLSNNYLSTAVLDEGTNRMENDEETKAEGKPYTMMEHKWDEAYGYLFGLSTDQANPLETLGEDNFLNKYLSRVNGDTDFNNIADKIYQAFKLGRAAIVAGDYTVRDEQAETIRELIGEVIAIRTVYYLQQAKNSLPTSGSDFGPAFHDLSEGLGFVYSLRFIRGFQGSESLFSKTEVDGFINILLANDGFWDVTPQILDSISESIARKFDFTVAQAGS